jgi:glycine dehydrogenase
MTNASLLDEATAAAEAMTMCFALTKGKRDKFFVSDKCHPQTIGLIQTRADAVGITVTVGDVHNAVLDDACAGVLIQYPDTYGVVAGFEGVIAAAHQCGALVVCATDLLALTQLKPPGEWGVDIAVGSAQRFGVPMGFGGPHAGFMATSDKYARRMPGRIIGVTIDSRGKPALRMAMQTREQHIRRDKATSNICTAQALLANMAASYGIYHGPNGLKAISGRVHALAATAASALKAHGAKVSAAPFFDTFTVAGVDAAKVQANAVAHGCNVRVVDKTTVGLSFGEAHTAADVANVLAAFGVRTDAAALEGLAAKVPAAGNGSFGSFARTSAFMTHPTFNTAHSESQMMRYLRKLEGKDIALNHAMIPLGSCTMKLNAVSEMRPVTWPKVCGLHPFVPADQATGYHEMINDLNKDLAEITGFAAVSAQPNSGAQGEYAGLLCIKAYQTARGEGHRDVCIIPVSAHGTNPASAVMAGYKVVTVKTCDNGDVDFEDLKAKVEKHSKDLAALMVTYPSTYGVFEEGILDICNLVHKHGGQVYMDGANMNAQVGLTSPGNIGADVCHLNLHKTFCIPHGGGGPGVGSIGVAAHLAPFLPGHTVVASGGEGTNVVAKSGGAVAGAPYGSAAILPISWMYIKMLGTVGLEKATKLAILNANYMAKRLEKHYNVRFARLCCPAA